MGCSHEQPLRLGRQIRAPGSWNARPCHPAVALLLGMSLFGGQRGYASYYGTNPVKERLNITQADGGRFDPRAFTCASWDYPFGTRLRVCRDDDTHQCVLVTVTDRGPNKRYPERIIDLTPVAFRCLDRLEAGLVRVTVTAF